MRWYGDQNKNLLSSNYVGRASLQCHGPSKWVWLRLVIKENRISILKKVVICYQLRPDIQTYRHRPRYTANANTDVAEINVCAQKCQVPAWWLLLLRQLSSETTGDMWIKFFLYVGFSTATTAMSGQKQTLMLQLFTGTYNALPSTFRRALCMTFWLGLTCYSDGSVHRFTECFFGKRYQKHVAPERQGCLRSLGWTRRSCSLASQVTGPDTWYDMIRYNMIYLLTAIG